MCCCRSGFVRGVALWTMAVSVATAAPPRADDGNAAPGAAVASAAVSARVNDAFGLSASNVVALDVDTTPGVPVTVGLAINGVSYTLALRPYSVRAAGYQVLAQVADGSMVPMPPGVLRTMRGVVREVPGSSVAGSMLEDGLHAVISLGEDDAYWLEPISGRVRGAGPSDYVVYRSQDVLPTGVSCGVTDKAEMELHRRRAAQVPAGGPPEAGSCVAELACDADVEYFNTYGTVPATEARINSVINTMNLQYEAQVGITHMITAIVVRTANPDPYSSLNPEGRLCQFITEWTNNQGAIQRDVAHLFTGANIAGSVIGIAADIGGTGICVSNGGCSGGTFGTFGSYCMSESDFNGNFSCATDLSAHELGHLWGAFHCSCPNNTMNPSITCANSFTGGSINSITNYAASRTCLVGQCGGGPGGSNCCFSHGSSGCDDPTCESVICGADPFCCAVQWDQVCADAATINPSCPCGAGGGPANDNCADASPIGDGSTPFDTTGATTDGPSHPECDFGFADGGSVMSDVWFDYVATCSGNLTVSTCNTAAYDTKMAVYDGCACPPSPILGCNDDGAGCGGFTSELTVPVQAGNCYKIRIGGFNGATGTGTLNITCAGTQCTPPDCDDGNPCTTDACNGGTCANTPNTLPCNDGDPCTMGDTCGGGTCQSGTPLNCNDGNVCTTDFCVGGVCQHQNNALPCSDGDPCTSGDACSGGACVPGTPTVCDDGNPCTLDLCVGGGCTFTPISGPCDDGNLCTTGDTCSNGQCSGTPVNCDDQNACTDDFCDTGTGVCVKAPNNNPCDDGDPCTTNDICAGGTCVAGLPVDCDDGNVCTTDTCVGGACQHVNNALPCTDGDPCTANDACAQGVCGGTPIVPCIPVEIRFTPVVSNNPNATIDVSDPLDPEIVIDAGDAVLIEVQALHWDGDLSGDPRLRTIQSDLMVSSLTSGSAGAISVLDLDTNDDGICDAATALCPICSGSDLRGVYVDSCRNRCGGPNGAPCDPFDPTTCGGNLIDCVPQPTGNGFIDFFPNLPGGGPITSTTNPDTLVTLVTMPSNIGVFDDGETHYVASYVFQAGLDARGTFTFEPFADGDQDSDNGGTFARASDSVPILPINLGRARITIAEGSCCLADGSCVPNVSRPACTALEGFFRLGDDCPPPLGNGPACVCPVDVVCPEIRLTPVFGTGTGVTIDATDPLDPEIVLNPGEAVLVEVETLDWDADLNGIPALRTVQVDLKTASLISGTAGSMAVLDLDADNNGTCDVASELCPICAGSDLRGVYVDTCRHRCNGPGGAPCNPFDPTTCGGNQLACVPPTGFADFYAELPGSSPITLTINPNTLVTLVTMQTGTGAISDGETHYVSSFVLVTSPDARGTFTLEQFVDGDPNSNNGGSFARASDSVPILPMSLGQVRITIAEGSCCFTDQSCTPNVTQAECSGLGGFFRLGQDCPPPLGNGPPCGCASDQNCDDSNLCTVEFCCEVTDVPVVPCALDQCVAKSLLTYGDINNDTFTSGDDVNCLLDDIGGNPTSLACCDRLLGTCSGPGDTLPAADFQKKDLAPCLGCPQTSANPDVYDCNIDCSVAPCAAGLTCVTLTTGAQVCRDPNNMGDGFISGDGVNAVLDTIADAGPNDLVMQPCLNCGSPAASAPAYRWDLTVAPVGQASLTLVPAQRSVRPGASVEVELFIDAVADLRTFQVMMEVVGGASGSLEIESVTIDDSRRDFVFGGLTTVSTTSVSRGLMLSTLPSGGVKVAERAYLGTYVLRSSPNASGEFGLQLRLDGNTLLRTSLSEVIAVSASKDQTRIKVVAPD